MSTIQYEEQAETFLSTYGLTFVAEYPTKSHPIPWEHAGMEWAITLGGKRDGNARRVSFPFWNSINAGSEEPSAYDVLACISGDTYCPATFKEFCDEYSYDMDSRKAEAQWKRCKRFAEKLQAFFTAQEIEALQEIQ